MSDNGEVDDDIGGVGGVGGVGGGVALSIADSSMYEQIYEPIITSPNDLHTHIGVKMDVLKNNLPMRDDFSKIVFFNVFAQHYLKKEVILLYLLDE